MNLKRFLAWVLIGFLFVDNIYIANHWGFDFRIQYIVFLLTIPVYLIAFPLKVNPASLISGFLVAMFLLISPLIAGTPLIGSIRQLLLIFTCAFPFYCLFNSFDFQVVPPFRIYLFFARAISILAIAQFAFIILKFKPGYDYSYLGFDMSRLEPETLRIQAWMAEPSFLAYILIPAVFYYLVQAFNSQEFGKKSGANVTLVVTAMLLTRSLISFVSIAIALIVILFSKYAILRKPIAIISSVILVAVFSFSAYQIPPIKMRVDDTIGVINGQELSSVNISTFYFFNNLNVATRTVENNPFFGTGFGNYYVQYEKYGAHDYDDPTITPDGASLLFRLLTETGLIFTGGYLLWVFRIRLKMSDVSLPDGLLLWTINNAVFVLIIMRLIRLPHYTALGFPFFILLYYLSCYNGHSKKSNKPDVIK